AAVGLFVSMFLPWYSETVVSRNGPKPVQTSLTAFQDFSFVEAAVLVVSAGVLAMLFARAERRGFELPGSDGLIVMIAGGWTAVLPAGRPQTPASAALGDRSAPRPRPRYPPAPGDQMSLEDHPPESP